MLGTGCEQVGVVHVSTCVPDPCKLIAPFAECGTGLSSCLLHLSGCAPRPPLAHMSCRPAVPVL